MVIKCLLFSGKPKPLPPPRSQSLDTFISKKGSKDDDEDNSDEDDDNQEIADIDEKDNTIEESFGPDDQTQTPQQSPSQQTVYANLGQSRTGLAPLKPQRSVDDCDKDRMNSNTGNKSPGVVTRKLSIPSTSVLSILPTNSMMSSSNSSSAVSPTSSANISSFHAKTSSITGSINSEAMSDSTISFPSSMAQSKTMDHGSEADSERDSVSPQRLHDEVSRNILVYSSLVVRWGSNIIFYDIIFIEIRW